MKFKAVERPDGGFQRPVSADEIIAMCRRAFGAGTEVRSAIELSGGLYNNTYRVDVGETVILRVAPAPALQSRSEHALMRNEHAALPYFAPIAAMMPRTLFTDWTHEIIGRDYLFQTMLDGVSAADGLHAYPREAWTPFYHQLGSIARTVHAVRGARFGPVGGPTFATWSDAVLTSLEERLADLYDAGLDTADLREVITLAGEHTELLDEITEPRLLHGDLWTPNLMLASGAPKPTITGVLDHDRALWGDPAADWPIYVAGTRPGWVQEAFRSTYGETEGSTNAWWRSLIYRAWHIAAARMERQRLGKLDKIQSSYDDMREVLVSLLPRVL